MLFTFFMLLIYRIGFWVPLPGVDQTGHAGDRQEPGRLQRRRPDWPAMCRSVLRRKPAAEHDLRPGDHAVHLVVDYFQLLTTVVPSLEKLQKEGETGRKKIQEWSRYATVPLCMIQAVFLLNYMQSGPSGTPLVHAAVSAALRIAVSG